MMRSPIACSLAISLLSLAACGGRATQDEEGPGAASGGNGTGGHPTGGAGTGGFTVGGAAGRATGSGGATPDASCTAPPEPGTCELEVWQFRHDPELALCVPYEFNACDLSPNRYATRDECLAACRGGEPDLDACTGSQDCLVTSLGCCGPCEPVAAGQLVAIHRDRATELRQLTGCGDVQCEQCLPVAPNDQTLKYLYGACENGQCTVRDLRERPVAECNAAADCALRCGSGCCPDCTAAGGVVAYRAGADLAAELCGDAPSACDDCDCQIPPEYAADCVEGRCVAVIGPVCEPGLDQTCNADPLMSSIAGTCNPNGTCTCDVWIDPATGRCQ